MNIQADMCMVMNSVGDEWSGSYVVGKSDTAGYGYEP